MGMHAQRFPITVYSQIQINRSNEFYQRCWQLPEIQPLISENVLYLHGKNNKLPD